MAPSEPPITQMTISLTQDGNIAGAVTANGSSGSTKTASVEFKTMSWTMHISLDFPEELIDVQKLQIL